MTDDKPPHHYRVGESDPPETEKPIISLVSVRDYQPRNTTEERFNLANELRGLALPSDVITAAVDEAMLSDWLIRVSRIILQKRCVPNPDELTIVELAKSMRRGIERRVEGKWKG